MLVGDLIYSDSFDVNCIIKVYRGDHNDDGELLYNSDVERFKPLDSILDSTITYITVNDRKELIIECE